MAGKETICIIISINPSMNESLNGKTKIEFAKESASLLLRQKLLFNQKDHFSICVFGGEEDSGEVSNAGFIKSMDIPEIETFDKIKGIEVNSKQNSSDILETIEYVIEKMKDEYGKKKFNKRIFLITDGKHACDSNKVKRIINLVTNNDIKLNIIAIDMFDELDLEDGEVDDAESKLTHDQLRTKKALTEIQEQSNDQVKIFSSLQASMIQNQFRKKKVNPVVKYRGPLRISPKLSLDVLLYVKTSVVNIPSLKKYSLASEFQPDIKANEISNEKIFCIHDDPDHVPISEENRTKAYYYGKSLIPFSKEDELSFKCLEDKCFKAIGFTDNYRVPRHHFMAGTDIVIPDPSDVVQVKAFTALVESMILTNKVLLCRLVTRAKSEPKLVVLIPHIGQHGAILYLNQLPTVEDIRDYQFDSLQPCTQRQEEVMSNFIDNLDLDGNEEDEEILKPSETFNPILQYFYECLEHRALNGLEEELPEMSKKIESLLNPTKLKLESNPLNKALEKVFPITKQDKKNEKKKKIFWRDIIQDEVETGINENRAEEKLGKQKDDEPDKISALKPIEDFNLMINYKYKDLTEKALEQMKSIIVKLINESFKGSYYIKALECIKVLREKCDETDEAELFNIFLKDLLVKFTKEKFPDFWKLIISCRITLIHEEENKKSTVTKEVATQWLSELEKKPTVATTIDFDEILNEID